MVTCFSYGDTALVEQFVDGVEIAISVIDRDGSPEALPAVEITVPSGVYDYEARYTAGETDFFVPARISDEAAAGAKEQALIAHRILGLRDISRTDAIVDGGGIVHFLEVNVSPGLTETSLLPMAARAAGIQLGTLYRDLLVRAAHR
jgi:D-alanine-D-alanine ligase